MAGIYCEVWLAPSSMVLEDFQQQISGCQKQVVPSSLASAATLHGGGTACPCCLESERLCYNYPSGAEST